MDIIETIRNLYNKAADAAHTESEVAGALAHAQRLMQKHGITEAQIRNVSSVNGIVTLDWKGPSKKADEIKYVMSGIAAFTDTDAYQTWDQKTGMFMLRYVGYRRDAEIAVYLTDLINNSINFEFDNYLTSRGLKEGIPATTRNNLRKSFKMAMVSRLRARLMEMVAERAVEVMQGATGTNLVVLKRENVAIAMAGMNLNIRTTKSRKRKIDVNAYNAGRDAADRVNITTGITF
jgi:Protein of unknown function (DUF2786)